RSPPCSPSSRRTAASSRATWCSPRPSEGGGSTVRSSSASDTADTPSGPAATSAGETASAAPGEGEGQPHRALVTGGSRGVGLAIALRLAADGWHTTVAGRDEETLKQAADTALERGLLLHTARADVTDETSVRQLFAEVTADG